MKISRKKYQEIKHFDHKQMNEYLVGVQRQERQKVHKTYQEALESIPGIGQKRREEIERKVKELEH